MPRFVYQVRDSGGRMGSGHLKANTLAHAAHVLRTDGKVIIKLQEEPALQQDTYASGANKRVKRDDVIHFATQLAVMVDTGVPVAEALDAIAEQTSHLGLRALVRNICEQVKGGTEFSAALEGHRRVFSKLFVAMMRASEASGTMGPMLQRASRYMESERETRKKMKAALAYPLCILCFCAIVVVGLFVFVMPRFEKIYSGKGAVLPLPTRVLMGISAALVGYWPLFLAGLIGLAAALYFYLRTPSGGILLDEIRIRIPLLGPIYRKAYLARSLRTLATMVSSGVSMLEGLDIASQVTGSPCYTSVWKGVAGRVKEGSTLSEPLFACRLVPTTVSQMVAAGERTGRLGEVLDRVAKFCEDDVNIAVKTATSLVEPAMIIVMGFIVGGVALALLLPVFSISRVLAH